METLHSSWNPEYHLKTLSNCGGDGTTSPSSSSPSTSSSIAALITATNYLVGCDTPPTDYNCDSIIFNNQNNTNNNMFYVSTPTIDQSTITMTNINFENNLENIQYQSSNNYNVPSDYYNNINNNGGTTGQSSFLNNQTTNYSIPTSMKSPANTCYSSPSPSPDLWEMNYGLNESVNQQSHCNLEQQLDPQQQTNHSHHHHLNQHQHSIVTNYHNQHSYQQQIHHHQNNLDDNKITYTTNDDNIITNTANNNNTTINTITNTTKVINVKTKNTINPIKSSNYRGSYKIKKSQNDTNFIIKTESNNINENSPKISTGSHKNYHHRSIESRGGGLDRYSTPEDEERRRRRRERNKVAATKCRNKKKVHVYKLCQESQTLESTNCSLKEEMENLKREEQRLNDILVKHLPFCVRRTLQPISDTINM